MTESAGSPFGPFWNALGVDFTHSVVCHLSYSDHDIPKWIKQ